MQNFQTNFNPFYQNVAIIKSYFKKPVILTQGILYIVSSILSVVSTFVMMPAMNNYFNMFLSIPEIAQDMTASEARFFNSFMSVYTNIIVFASLIPSIIMIGLTAAAFLIIYKKSKNDDPASTPKTGVTILFVLSIVQLIPIIIASAILLLAILLLIVESIITSSSGADEAALLWVLTIIYTFIFGGMIAIFLLYFINQVRFYKSVLNSLTTVNLSYKGAGIFGVFSIIYGVITAMSSLSSFSITPILNAMTELEPEIVFVVDMFGTLTPVFMFSAVTSIFTAAITVISGIIALGYKKHIKSYTEGFSDYTTSEQNAGFVGDFVMDTPPVQESHPTHQSAPQINESKFEPVVFNDNSPIKQNTYCPRCGTPAKEGDVFCNACGTKL